MSLPYRIGLTAVFLISLVAGVYLTGYRHGREETLKDAVAAYQTRERINHETDNLNPVDLCIALGGERYECRNVEEALK